MEKIRLGSEGELIVPEAHDNIIINALDECIRELSANTDFNEQKIRGSLVWMISGIFSDILNMESKDHSELNETDVY